MEHPDLTPALTPTVEPSVWTHCLGKTARSKISSAMSNTLLNDPTVEKVSIPMVISIFRAKLGHTRTCILQYTYHIISYHIMIYFLYHGMV